MRGCNDRWIRRAVWLLLCVGSWTLPACGRDNPREQEHAQAIPLHLDHIFKGSINRRGDLVGLHHIPSAPNEMRADGRICKVEFAQTSPGGPKDVVTARVMLRDPATGKVVREKFSTLFPSDWTRAEIEAAIREAYADAKRHNGVDREGGFHGHARGIRIDGYLTRDGEAIATAFPVMQSSKKNAPQKKNASRNDP
jgi:hypothetical protein